MFTSASQVSEPSSLALRLRVQNRRFEAFLHPTVDEFAHIHRSGFLHLTVPMSSIDALTRLGWIEPHPISRRPGFPDSIVMLYAPRDADELDVAVAVLQSSYQQAVA